jgi:hypothetical protein
MGSTTANETLSKLIRAIHQLPTTRLIPFIGVSIAIWVMWIQRGWINDDAVLYFEVARLYADGQFQSAMQLFPWPFYSVLIACIHKVTGFNIHLSAQLLNAVLFGVCSYAYVRLIQTCGGDRRVQLYGTVILFSSTYIMGDVLPMLIRDQGFWAFTLLSYVFFIQFYQHAQWRDALLWQVFIGIAILFRIEAISIAIILPALLWFDQAHAARIRLCHYLIANSLGLMAISLITLSLAVFQWITPSDLGRLNQLVDFMQGNFIAQLNQLNEKSAQFGQQILGNFLDEFSLLGLCTALLAIVVAKIVLTTGLIQTALGFFGTRDAEQTIEPKAYRVLIWLLCIHFMNTCVIITGTYVLSGRYVAGFSLVLMVFASFALAKLAHPSASTRRMRYRKPLLFIISIGLLLSFAKIIWPKPTDYNYEQLAVNWIKQHNVQQKPVLYISPRARFYAGQAYAGRGYDYWEYLQQILVNKKYHQYGFIVINIEREHLMQESELLSNLGEYAKVNEFFGPKKKKKLIILEKPTKGS